MLENVVRSKYFETGVHIKNPIKNSYQGDLGRTIQTLDHIEGKSYNTHIIANKTYNVWHVYWIAYQCHKSIG